jgi:hypothetical protein
MPLNIYMDVGLSVPVNDSDGKYTVPDMLDIGSEEHLRVSNHWCPPVSDHKTSPWPWAINCRLWVHPWPLVLLALKSTVSVYFFIRSYFPSTVPGAEDVDLGRSDVVPAFTVYMFKWKRKKKKQTNNPLFTKPDNYRGIYIGENIQGNRGDI